MGPFNGLVSLLWCYMTNHDQVAICTQQYIEYKPEKLEKQSPGSLI